MDIAWDNNEGAVCAPKSVVASAKLHLLGLAPIKKRLGRKWERLSALVHSLLKKAIVRAQGPGDHFVVLDELSYAVTFANLSFAEAQLVCAAIAREVCEHLFGNQIDEAAFRSIVAEIAPPTGTDQASIGRQIGEAVERSGTETIFTHDMLQGATPSVGREPNLGESSAERIRTALAGLAQFGLEVALVPVWELRKGTSNSLFLAPVSRASGRASRSSARPGSFGEREAVTVAVALLEAAEAYLSRLHDVQKVCAIGVGVSYAVLGCLPSRMRYLAALQKVNIHPKTPLLLRIEQIPAGAPEGRIAELVAMLRLPNIRVMLEFQDLAAGAQIDIRLGADGIGGALPPDAGGPAATGLAEKLARYAQTQKAFSFLTHLDSPASLAAANQGQVRFGSGLALADARPLELDFFPDFPLVSRSPDAHTSRPAAAQGYLGAP